MPLRAKVAASQSKKAHTQYITIPAVVVQDSQYPFEADEELNLMIDPTRSLIILSKQDKLVDVTPEGVLLFSGYADLKLKGTIAHPSSRKETKKTEKENV